MKNNLVKTSKIFTTWENIMEERTDLYEATLILKEAATAEIEKNIKEYAEIKKTTDIGVKQFAYPIGKLTSGHYLAVEFVSNRDNLSKIEQALKNDKNVIRFLLTKAIRKGPEPVRTGEWAKKEEKPAKPVSDEISQVKEEPVAEAPAESKEAPTSEAVGEVKPEEPKAEEPKTQEAIIAEPVVKKVEEAKPAPKKPAKKQEKLVAKKPRAKAEKVSAAELDKKLEELVKEY